MLRILIFSTSGTEATALNALLTGYTVGSARNPAASRFYWDVWLPDSQVHALLTATLPATVRMMPVVYYGTHAEHTARADALCAAWNGSTMGIDYGSFTAPVIINGEDYNNEYPWCVKDAEGNITISDLRIDGNNQTVPMLYVDNVAGKVTIQRVILLRHKVGVADGAIQDYAALVTGGSIAGGVVLDRVAGFLNRGEVICLLTLPKRWGVKIEILRTRLWGGSQATKGLQLGTVTMGHPWARRAYVMENGKPRFLSLNAQGEPWTGIGGTGTEPYRGAGGGTNLRGGFGVYGELCAVESPGSGNRLKFVIPADAVSLWEFGDPRTWVYRIDWSDSGDYKIGRCVEYEKVGADRTITIDVFNQDGSPVSLPASRAIRWDAICDEWWGEVEMLYCSGGDSKGYLGGGGGGAAWALYGIDGGIIAFCTFEDTTDYGVGVEYGRGVVFYRLRSVKFIEATFWAEDHVFEQCNVPSVALTPNGRTCRNNRADHHTVEVRENSNGGVIGANPRIQIRRFERCTQRGRTLAASSWSDVSDANWLSSALTPGTIA